MTDSPAKRAPVTGTRVVRSKGDVRSPLKSSLGSSTGSIGEDKKKRPYTTPSRPGQEKRDPTTPTRTVRPYRPNTGGVERPSATGMMAVVESDDFDDPSVNFNEPIEWINEETPPPLPSQPSLQQPQRQQQQQPLELTSSSFMSLGRDGCRVRTGSKTLIGKGSFGHVYKGLHEGTNQIVAIKEVHLTGESADKVTMIKKEIQLMKRLDHPNIVRYLGAERVRTQLHIYLEFVTGGSMASLVKEYGPLTEVMARKYSKQVLDGLHYLHKNKIVHRDIKGDNLLVGTDGTVKLADFGTSKELRTLAVTVTGTACFMAPEVIRGTGHGLESDIWSFGCAVIEMLNGRPPFANFNGNQYATMMHIAGLSSVGDEIPSHIEGEVRGFLGQCLQISPENRSCASQLQDCTWFHPSFPASPPAVTEIVPDNEELSSDPHSPHEIATDAGDFNPMLSYVGSET